MSSFLEAPTEVARPHPGTVSTLASFALIGIALAAVADSSPISADGTKSYSSTLSFCPDGELWVVPVTFGRNN
jgi:hypothetical protein